MPTTLKERLRTGARANVFAVGRLFHPNMIEIYAAMGGFDGFWIDYEHTGFTIREIEAACTAGRAAGLDPFVRIPPTDYALVTRCFESGASGVMASQISSVEEARQFVQWSRFAPEGCRGLNSLGFDGRYGLLPLAEFCRQANERAFVGIQIETVSALESCEEIAALPGVDFLFLGPADLSQALGVTGDLMHPLCTQAVKRVGKACTDAGKVFASVTVSSEHLQLLLKNGCRMISPTNDVRTFTTGVRASKEQYPELFQER